METYQIENLAYELTVILSIEGRNPSVRRCHRGQNRTFKQLLSERWLHGHKRDGAIIGQQPFVVITKFDQDRLLKKARV